MQTLRIGSVQGRAYVYAGGLAAVWLVAAGLNGGTTYHLAPFLVAATLPIVLAFDIDRTVDMRTLVTGATAGGVLALAVTAALAVADKLQGPSILSFGGAATESVVFALAGTATGLVIAVIRTRT